MELFEQKFKRFLTEGDRFGYPLGDEDTFLGFGIHDYNLSEHFPEVYEFIENVYDEYDSSNWQESEQDIKTFLTPSYIRTAVGDKETDRFLEYAKKLTDINESLIDIIGSYSHIDMSGAETSANVDHIRDGLKQEALEEISSIFAETPPEDLKYDDIRLSLNNNYTGNQFEPYILVEFTDNESGDGFEVVLDATEDDYKSVFDEKVREVKDVVENTLSTSFN